MTTVMPRDKRLSRFIVDWSARMCLERDSLDALSGQAATFARAGAGAAIDRNGRVYRATHSQPRWHYIDRDGDGIRESPTLLLDGNTRTNVLLRSQEFDNAAWTKTNVTVTANATLSPDGVNITADKIAATTTAAATISQAAVITATSASYSVFIKKGSSATTANRFGMRNTTLSTDLLFVSINYDTLAITYITGATGAFAETCENGWIRLTLTAAAGITSGNSVTAYAGFTGSAATAGDFLYAWGAQLEAGQGPSMYIATTTATQNRVPESLTFPMNRLPNAMTVFVDAQWYVAATGGTNFNAFAIPSTTTPYFLGRINGVNVNAVSQHDNGSGPQSSSAAITPTIGQRIESRHVLQADGSTITGASVAGGAEVVSATSTAIALAAAWSSAILRVGTDTAPDSGQPGFLALSAIRIAAGTQSLAYMREG